MLRCASCGRENPSDARFCNACGASLAVTPPSAEQLKTISVLFADVTGSTELGERLDPEAVRRIMERYFDLARRVITRHGGTVEKFIGDAVMAVFGVPVVHEDDALRAVRAAADLRAELPALNADLGRAFDTTLRLRTGVNTGEAVTASDEWLAVGDAVNLAARLEQAAAPDEILLGPATVALVRDAVVVEPLGPVTIRGKSEPVRAHRLIEVLGGVQSPKRRSGGAMVGRSSQRRMLEDAFALVVREHMCSLFTVLGVAGVGKSRLVSEFLAGIDATVVRGNCLSYGEGITYWPVAEIVRSLLVGEDASRLPAVGDDGQAAAIRALLGESATPGSAADIAFAVRRLLERAAAERPLVVVLDDVHWGEQTFFDLVEQVADLSRDAPILLLCMARPELLERRPTWGGGKLNSSTVLLEPLGPAESEELIDLLLPSGVDPELRSRALETGAGNPFFLEEIAAAVSSGGDVSMPPTIQALLSARLDQLEPEERRVLERGAVEGRSFHRGAVEALGAEQEEIGATLVTLVRKDLVRPQTSQLQDDEAYRFRHLLIRDAAYDGLPKSARADLHERFACWLEVRAGDLAELDEIVGYHLEQAHRYRRELGSLDDEAMGLGRAAARHLQVAGRRALDRGDGGAAINLLERASRLVAEEGVDLSLELSVAWALFQNGRLTDALARTAAASAAAEAAADRIGQLRADLSSGYLLLHLDPEGRLAELEQLIEEARPLFEAAGDNAALGSLWMATWGAEHFRCRFGSAAEAAERAVGYSSAAGDTFLAGWCRTSSVSGIAFGPTPVDEALGWLAGEVERGTLHQRLAWFWETELLAVVGRFDEARAIDRADVQRMTELGDRLGLALSTGWIIEMEAARYAEAEQAARKSCRLLEEMDERVFWSTKACELAETLYSLDRCDEAEEWAHRAAEAGGSDDIFTQLLYRQVLAKVAGRRRLRDEVRRLRSETLAIVDRIDAPHSQGQACLDVAEALLLVGEDGAEEEACRAGRFFRQKGATNSERRATRFLEDLRNGRPASARPPTS